jgi:cytochrome P450
MVPMSAQVLRYPSFSTFYTDIQQGPNHVFICDAKALNIVMSAKPFQRAERMLWFRKCLSFRIFRHSFFTGYAILKLPGTTGSVIELIDPHEHAERKRIWERSMNTSAVQGYSNILAARVTQIVDALEKRQDATVDLSSWLSFFS